MNRSSRTKGEKRVSRPSAIQNAHKSTSDYIALSALLRKAIVLFEKGSYDEAEQLYHRCINICEQQLEQKQDDSIRLQIAQIQYLLSLLLKRKNNYTSAEKLIRCCIETKEAILEPNDSEIADAYFSLASLLFCLRMYADAAKYYCKCLNIFKTQIIPDQLKIKNCQGALGIIVNEIMESTSELRNLGRYNEAITCCRQALEIAENQSAKDSIDNILSCLAGNLLCVGNYTEAEIYCRRALNVMKNKLGTNNTQVAEQFSLLN
jgi:tetratricopeptide (TPR) repeat protein